MEKALFLVRSAPYGTASSGEAYRAIIGLGGMGLPTSVVLMCDGVFNAVKGQEPAELDMQPIEKAYESISEFDVTLYILDKSAEDRGLNKEGLIDAEIIDCDKLKQLIDDHDCVISFS